MIGKVIIIIMVVLLTLVGMSQIDYSPVGSSPDSHVLTADTDEWQKIVNNSWGAGDLYRYYDKDYDIVCYYDRQLVCVEVGE